MTTRPYRQTQRSDTRERRPSSPIPSPAPGELRTVILGGVSEIGKNMYALEYNDTIVLFECGTMFGESSTPGVSMLMPNIAYLKARAKKIRAVIVTDTSMQYIGALPYVMPMLGTTPIYCRSVTKAIIENRQRTIRRACALTFHEVEESSSLPLDDKMTLHFFGISSDTPNTMGVALETPLGFVVYAGAVQLRHTNGSVSQKEEEQFAFLKEKPVLLSLADSVNAERPGFAMRDEEILEKMRSILSDAPGRVLLPLYPSHVRRNCMVIEAAKDLGKTIYVEGDLLMQNIYKACSAGKTRFTEQELLPITDLQGEGDATTVIITSGAENESYDMLERMSQSTFARLKVLPEDTVAFPAPMIPTNARSTQNLEDRLSRLGAIIRSYETGEVKAGKHQGKDELRWMHQLLQPRFFIPIQGYHYMLTAHSHVFKSIGASEDSCVIPENGFIIDISSDGKRIKKLRQTIDTTPVSVDGHLPVPLQEVVVQDRKVLGQEGIIVVVLFFDPKKLVLRKSPDILSRGFIYLKESRDLIGSIRGVLKEVAEEEAGQRKRLEIDPIKKALQKKLQSFLMNETGKRPIIIPVIFTS